MKRFLASLTPEDILAFIVVIGCLVLKLRGADGGTDTVMTGVISYRLGSRVSKHPKSVHPKSVPR